MPEPGVTVTGSGTAAGRPDIATVSFGAEAESPTVAAAFARMGEATAAMVAVLGAAGIADADRQTGRIELRTMFEGAGYATGQHLTVRVRDLAGLGDLVSQVVTAGGDAARLHGLSFGFAHPDRQQRAARAAAWEDAVAKAEQYAALSGRRLGAVRRIEEGGGRARPARYAAEAASLAFVVESGSVDLTVTVEVEWAFAADH